MTPALVAGGESLYRAAFKDRPWEDLKTSEQEAWGYHFSVALSAYYRFLETRPVLERVDGASGVAEVDDGA